MPSFPNDLQNTFEVRIKPKLTPKLSAEVLASAHPQGAICALLEIDRVGLLEGMQAEGYVKLLLMHDNPAGISIALGIINIAYHVELHQLQSFTSTLHVILRRFLVGKDTWQTINLLQKMRGYGLVQTDTLMAYQNFVFLDNKTGNTAGYLIALAFLQNAGALRDLNAHFYLTVIYSHRLPISAAEDLIRLRKLGLLNSSKDFAVVRNSRFPGYCSKFLVKMQNLQLLPNQSMVYTYFKILRKKGKLQFKSEALDILLNGGLLDILKRVNALVYMLIISDTPILYAHSICTLHDLGILRVDNPYYFLNSFHLQAVDSFTNITFILVNLRRRGLFTSYDDAQTVFEHLLINSLFLLKDDFLMWEIARLPADVVVTAWHWQRIIEICRSQQTVSEIRAAISLFINEGIIAPAAEAANVSAYIHPQNTHKASIHLCSSQSAIKLARHYVSKVSVGKGPKVFQILSNEMAKRDHYLNKLEYPNIDDSTWMPKATRSFLDFVASFNGSLEPDPVSGIRLDQLMVLIWVAIHDHKLRTSKLVDAKNKFFEAMFEARRDGNNCSPNNYEYIDDFKRDDNACPSGAFNKFIEKLVSIHPFIFWMFVTNEGALDKLLREIPQQINLYLAEIGVTSEANLPAKEDILAVIRPRIKEVLFFEYGSIYISQKSELIRFNKSLLRYNTLQELQLAEQDYSVFQELLASNNNDKLQDLLDSIECFDFDKVTSVYIQQNEIVINDDSSNLALK